MPQENTISRNTSIARIQDIASRHGHTFTSWQAKWIWTQTSFAKGYAWRELSDDDETIWQTISGIAGNVARRKDFRVSPMVATALAICAKIQPENADKSIPLLVAEHVAIAEKYLPSLLYMANFTEKADAENRDDPVFLENMISIGVPLPKITLHPNATSHNGKYIFTYDESWTTWGEIIKGLEGQYTII